MDFPELIFKKAKIVSSTPQICELLGEVGTSENSDISLQSERYYAVGCDLADAGKLDELVGTLVDLSKCLVLCTAEVSITYMNVHAADSLIAWAARQNDSTFKFLECLTQTPNIF